MGTKRAAEDIPSDRNEKRNKTKKQWRVPRKTDDANKAPRVISPGDSGIWATCNKGRERACVGELRDLFNEYAELLYGSGAVADADEDEAGRSSVDDIESEVNAEVAELKHPSAVQLFTPIRVDVQCVVFFKTVTPVEPVSFVTRICEDAMNDPKHKRTRYAKRLSPMTLMARASTEALEKLAYTVLAPSFHQTPPQARKFAIRPTLRNHTQISRNDVIQLIARVVGPGHSVDLKNYDLLIIVELFQNVCGMSVVGNNFERLKRFNLSEIYDPTPNQSSTSGATGEQTAQSKPATAASPNDMAMEVEQGHISTVPEAMTSAAV